MRKLRNTRDDVENRYKAPRSNADGSKPVSGEATRSRGDRQKRMVQCR